MKWVYTLTLLLGTLACSTLGYAQTVVPYNTVAFGSGGRGINNPTVTVCAHVQPPTNPCTGTLATLYANSALGSMTNPFLGDTFGNVNFWAAPGIYDISIAASLLPTYTYSITLSGVSISAGSNISFTGNNTHSGTELFAGLAAAISTKSSPYTLTAFDSWINVTGTTTITIPHLLTGQIWHVKNTGTAIVTLSPDSGTLDGVASIPLLPQNSTEVTCDGTNCQTGLAFPYTIAEVNLSTQAANIATATLYAVPAGGAGVYRISAYEVLTQAATSSSTLPSVNIAWTDADSSAAETGTPAASGGSGNTVGNTNFPIATSPGIYVVSAKASTNIQYSTAGYASSGATPMQYALHIRLEYLGP